MIKVTNDFLFLNTKKTSLVLEIKPFIFEDVKDTSKKFVTQRYYGNKINQPFDSREPLLQIFGSNLDFNRDYLISSSFGDCNNLEPSLIISNDNTYTHRFFFKEAKIIQGAKEINGPHVRNVNETLEIIEIDDISNIELHTYYSLCSDSDIITVKKEIINNSNSIINVNRLFSLMCPIEGRNIEITTLDGEWLDERNVHRTTLNSGVFINQSILGSSSHKHNPYVEVKNNDSGMIFAFNLIFSGNHKTVIEVDPITHTNVMIGLNDFAFKYSLKEKESFITPEAIMCVGDKNENITHEMHRFINNHIINPSFQYKPRPILFNSWEGFAMNINEKNLIEVAKIAKELGIELFVIDDGWFNHRDDDCAGLGDWFTDKRKFPHGLGNFANQIRNIGLSFGIWVEPEMVSINSSLYKNNPHFAQQIPNVTPLQRRHQLLIDMTNIEVRDYLEKSLDKIFEETKPEYVKWDYNRTMSDIYVYGNVAIGEYTYRYIYGLYDLLEKLTTKNPQILFESCASGGGRYDLGMLYYMPQTWGSDNTNTYHRSFISNGTLRAYPQSTYGVHVTKDDSVEKFTSSLEDRFNLNCIGAFGYEFDLKKCVEDDMDIIKKQIEFFKKYRDLIQFGDYYLSDDNFIDNHYFSFSIVSFDKTKAIYVAAELDNNVKERNWKIKGLDNDALYKISMRKQDNAYDIKERIMTGYDLLNRGIDLPLFNKEKDKNKYPNGTSSRMFILERIK